jgi:hypothetical protein
MEKESMTRCTAAVQSIVLLFAVPLPSPAAGLDWVEVAADHSGFVLSESGKTFTPWGFNYDHDGDGELLEDYWDERWPAVESAFQEMKGLGANVVRIHLQFGKFMHSPTEPRRSSIDQLARLVKLAEATGLYLNVTGLGCYHKADVPPWYDKLSESERWQAQAVFWEAVAQTCATNQIAGDLDFMAVHIYPEKANLDDAIETLKGFAAVGKPVVIEEIFPLKCDLDDLSHFIDESRQYAAGWIGFYWGQTPDQLRPATTIPQAMTLGWLELFQAKTPQILHQESP